MSATHEVTYSLFNNQSNLATYSESLKNCLVYPDQYDTMIRLLMQYNPNIIKNRADALRVINRCISGALESEFADCSTACCACFNTDDGVRIFIEPLHSFDDDEEHALSYC